MKNLQIIKFKAFVLLLVYLLSISPSAIIHHHENETVSLENATSCEKVIYYSYRDGHCKHESHVAQAHEKCLLCDHHTSTPHSLNAYYSKYFSKESISCHLFFGNKYFPITLSTLTNRGPPFVSVSLV